MSLHEDVMAAIHREIEAKGGATFASPTMLALAVQGSFRDGPIEAHLQYTSLEHLKQLSRLALRRYEHEGDNNPSHQADIFSGVLQDRYPIPRPDGADPVYKLRDALTDEEVRWNILHLRKSAAARLEHADALEAWADGRRALRA